MASPSRYEIWRGPRRVSVRDASTPQAALIDHMRALGCDRNEIIRIRPGSVAWRGAVYSAVPIEGAAHRGEADPGASRSRPAIGR